MFFRLNTEGEAVPCSMQEWVKGACPHGVSMDVAKTKIDDDTKVSTVFLSVNCDGTPWETMVFIKGEPSGRFRCEGTRNDALLQHEEVVRKLREKARTNET